MIQIKIIDFLLLNVYSISDVFKGKFGIDDDVFNAIDIEVPSFSEGVSYKRGDISIPEDVDDFLIIILVFFVGVGVGVGTFLMYFFPEFAHG